MRIDKQITICKLGTEMKIYPESKNEIGLWIAHPPCFVISANDLYGVENIVKNAIRYSNSGEFANEDSAKLVLREFRLKSWNVLFFPCHSVVEPTQFILRVWSVDGNEIEVFVL